MAEIFKHWLFVLLLGVMAVATNPARAEPTIPLTEEETAWLEAHPTIRLGVDPAYPPFEFIGKAGTYQGMASDYVALIAKRLGIDMTVSPGLSWSQVIEGVKIRQVDLLPMVAETPGRREFLSFTQPYITFPTVIMTQKDHPPVRGIEDFSGKTLALVKGYFYVEEITRDYPDVEIIFSETPLEALKNVSLGAADGFVGNLGAASYLVEKNNLLNLRVASDAHVQGGLYSFAVRKDWAELVPILDKALDSITQEEHQRIRTKWVSLEGAKASKQGIGLTDAEKAWIEGHKTIKIGVDSAYPPFEFIDRSGDYSGMASDYLKLMGKRLGVTFKVVPGLTWTQVVEGTKDGTVDVAPVMTPPP